MRRLQLDLGRDGPLGRPRRAQRSRPTPTEMSNLRGSDLSEHEPVVSLETSAFQRQTRRALSWQPDSADTLEDVKKLDDLGSPRPNEGEGFGGEGGGACRIEFRREAEEALQVPTDSACRHGTAIPLTPRPLSRVGARGAEIEVDFNSFTPSPQAKRCQASALQISSAIEWVAEPHPAGTGATRMALASETAYQAALASRPP